MGSRRSRMLALAGVALMLVAVVLPAAPALAGHGTCVIDLTPETDSNALGQTHTVTANLRPAGTDPNGTSTADCTTRAGGKVDVSFEVVATGNPTYTPGTVDAADTPTADLTCSINPNQNSCSVSYSRTTVVGQDTIRGFFDDATGVTDTVTKDWVAGVATFLNVELETDTNAPQTQHTLTATVRDQAGVLMTGANVDFEILTGPNANLDTNAADADLECTTGAQGTCTVNYTDGATNPAAPNNVDTICGWLDTDNDSGFSTAGGNEDGGDCDAETDAETEDSSVAGADTFGNDATDRVTKTWALTGQLAMTPATDTGVVGECNPFTITLTNAAGQPVSGATIDVEQVHALANNQTANDEPTVSFCNPQSGTNPSNVQENQGDLNENPDNEGTAGGETQGTTNAQGIITIGIAIASGNGSAGTGDVTVTAFNDADGDDDPDPGEESDTSTKTWVAPAARTIDCEPETASPATGTTHTVVCTVRTVSGSPLSGVSVTFTETGPGDFTTSATVITDNQGQAGVGVTSTTSGDQTVTGTITESTQGEPNTDECDRAANDPAGAPAGICADSVTVSWQGGVTCPQGAICGTSGNDTITGTPGDDVIYGLEGNDTINGGGGSDIIVGGPGDDTLNGEGGSDILKGGGGNDILNGGGKSDLLIGGGGTDTISGGGGDDLLQGGGANDRLFGNKGDDLLNGGKGNDVCRGGPGRDRNKRC